MKKVLSTLLVAGVVALVACGPSAEDKQKAEQQLKDSIDAAAAASDAASSAMQEQSALQDSANMMTDSTGNKMSSDSAR